MSRLLLTPFKKVRGELVTSEPPWRTRTFVTSFVFTTSGIGSRASRYEERLARGARFFSAERNHRPVNARRREIGRRALCVYGPFLQVFAGLACLPFRFFVQSEIAYNTDGRHWISSFGQISAGKSQSLLPVQKRFQQQISRFHARNVDQRRQKLPFLTT
jgi:hypothetical protein